MKMGDMDMPGMNGADLAGQLLARIPGLGVLVMTLPYPRGTAFGNTNLALILILLVIWLLRVTQRQSWLTMPEG